MGKVSTISSKGQITLPVEIRTQLGVKSGDRVEFYEEDGKTMLRAAVDPFDKWEGAVPAYETSEQHDAWLRGVRAGEDRESE